MATSRIKKEGQLQKLEAQFQNAKGISFVRFNRVTVEEAQNLRRDLRSQGMTYTVIKKTLMSLAAKNTHAGTFSSEDLEGNVAVIVSQADEMAPIAIIKKLKKDSFDKLKKESKFDFAGCMFEGTFQNAAQAALIADMPTREESLAKIMGALRSGPQKLHGVLNSGMQKLYNVLDNSEKFAS